MTRATLEHLLRRQLERERRAERHLRQRRREHDAAAATVARARLQAEAAASARAAGQADLYRGLLARPVTPGELDRCNARIDALQAEVDAMQARLAQAAAASELAETVLGAAQAGWWAESRRSEKWRRLTARVRRQALLRAELAVEVESEESVSDRLAGSRGGD
jgi:hypothetical protein